MPSNSWLTAVASCSSAATSFPLILVFFTAAPIESGANIRVDMAVAWESMEDGRERDQEGFLGIIKKTDATRGKDCTP